MCIVKTSSNITCIEKLEQIINSNLVTYIRDDSNCKIFARIKNELIDIDNHKIVDCYIGFCIYNIKLIEEHGLFGISSGYYYRFKKNYSQSEISKKEFFDSIKVGSLLETEESSLDTEESVSIIIDKIKEKFYKVSLILIVENNLHYYLIESPTLTKPARKNNSNN